MTTNFLVGSFIALFLIVFKPFQIDLWVTEYKTLKLIGFGFISFFVPAVISVGIHLFTPQNTLEDQWKIKHEIGALILTVCAIALGNLIYGNMLHIMRFTLEGYLSALAVVLAIGIFPISFYVLNSQNRLLKLNLGNASVINTQIETIQKVHATKIENDEQFGSNELVFISENEKEKLILKPSQLLYIESADNYSNIVFTENGNKKKQLIRSSLKRIESQLNSNFIMRCHRTFIINLKNVKHIEGNAAGYKLYFEENEEVIPVSRSFSSAIIEKLKTVK